MYQIAPVFVSKATALPLGTGIRLNSVRDAMVEDGGAPNVCS